ncbi:hypothetical protein NW762_006585 [Fusarium torreyae]|uniref:Uncharacterized protein n=1 Tax=Fusarium torreyae TaxID=1237075 RepID=A0A9W8VEH7_9HYPO|nr:hypothetical protein NW762_006585 [Fusarium torreyae]
MHFLKTLLFVASTVVAAPGSPPQAVDVSRRSSILETRNACGVDGVVNGQCGELWDFNDCTGHIVEHIKPDCSQTCNKVDEGKAVSVRAMGDGTYGTACYLYEDDNCTNEISHTSLGITATDKKCASTKDDRKIRSWKCTFKCHT